MWWPGGCPTPPDRGRGQALEADFCVDALKEALVQGRPEVFNTDQGSQFTSLEFTQVLRDHGVKISMDGKGRYTDNIFVERLWRTVKYEEVYLKAYANAAEARKELGAYLRFYNNQRPHQALGYRTPAEVFFGHREVVGDRKSGRKGSREPVLVIDPAAAGVNGGDKVGRVGGRLLSIGDLIVYRLPSFIGL